jgi:hypothetical protein
MYGRLGKCIQSFVEGTDEAGPLGRPGCKWENESKVNH